jgi:hydroxypyruvate isomerase
LIARKVVQTRKNEMDGTNKLTKKALGLGFAPLEVFAVASTAQAEQVTLQVAIKNHRFAPAELSAPANQPVMIEISNEDPTPAEFESKTLRVEKVVAGNSKISVQIRPLVPGRYRFFDDYHEDMTEGLLTVR